MSFEILIENLDFWASQTLQGYQSPIWII